MAGRLPKQFYRVVAVAAGDKIRWSEPGSKTYADIKHAQKHLDSLRARGVESYLYESEPVVWHLVSNPEPMQGQEPLPFD